MTVEQATFRVLNMTDDAELEDVNLLVCRSDTPGHVTFTHPYMAMFADDDTARQIAHQVLAVTGGGS